MVPALPGFPLAIWRGGQEGEKNGVEGKWWCISTQQKVKKIKYHWGRNRGDDPGTLLLLQPSCHVPTPMAERPSPKALSPAPYSLCIFKTVQLAITVRQHRQDVWKSTGKAVAHIQVHFRTTQMTRTGISSLSNRPCGMTRLGYSLAGQVQKGPSNTTCQDF